jgi:hypothetical protein
MISSAGFTVTCRKAVIESLLSAIDLLPNRQAGDTYIIPANKAEKLFGSDSAGQFPPRNQLDVLVHQNLAKFSAGEKIVISLSPRRSPR